eukprot:scaffold24714_cov43-Cyclotella_meneghiniana.AAC.2
MKLILSTVLALSISIGTNAVLPPGYEDDMWCPAGECKIYSIPFGDDYTGPSSSFYFCYNSDTEEVTDGVWTGSLTDVQQPKGWEKPELCSKEVYSECDYDHDCTPTLRTEMPSDDVEHSRGETCGCFADSVLHPFDQCQGETGDYCNDYSCKGRDPCKSQRGKCVIQDNGAGACTLHNKNRDYDDDWTAKPTKKPTKKPTRKPTPSPTDGGYTCGSSCSNDSDCFKGGFVQCGTCNKVHGTQGYNTCIDASIPSTPAPTPSSEQPMTSVPSSKPVNPTPSPVEPMTDMPIHMSMPMEDMFIEKRKRGYVRGAAKSKHDYYDGQYLKEEYVEFGRVGGVKAIA